MTKVKKMTYNYNVIHISGLNKNLYSLIGFGFVLADGGLDFAENLVSGRFGLYARNKELNGGSEGLGYFKGFIGSGKVAVAAVSVIGG